MAILSKYKKYRQDHIQGCDAGFTLIELMIVIAIVGVLAAIAVPQYSSYVERAQYTAAMAEMRIIDKEITSFNMLYGRYPNDLNEIGMGGVKDPWGNPYQYLNFDTVLGAGKKRKDHSMVPVNSDFDLYSMGPDGDSKAPFTAKASRDDIVRADSGRFIGKVSDY